MADELLNQVQDVLEGQIDFDGQRLAEALTTYLVSASGILAFIAGVTYQDIHLSLWTLLGGTILAALIVVPPWPFFNKHAVRWLPSKKNPSTIGPGITVDGQKIN